MSVPGILSFVQTPVGSLARSGIVHVADILKARVLEARATLAITVAVWLTFVAVGVWSLAYPVAYKQGFTALGRDMSQTTFAWTFLVLSAPILAGILTGRAWVRQWSSILAFVWVGTVLHEIWRGNPSSPVIPWGAPLCLFGCIWDAAAVQWAKSERKAGVGGV